MAKYTNDLYAAYRETRHSRRGIIAFVLGMISLCLLLILIGIGMATRGGAGLYAGGLGLSAFLMGAAGLVIGLRSFQDRCKSYIFSKIGTVLSSLLTAAWFLLICVGIGM